VNNKNNPMTSAAAQEAVACRYRNRRKNGEFFPWVYADKLPTEQHENYQYELLYAAPVTAAPGIDLEPLIAIRNRLHQLSAANDLGDGWADVVIELMGDVQTLIDASPKGDEAQQAGAQAIAIVHMEGYRWNGKHWQKDSPKGGSEALLREVREELEADGVRACIGSMSPMENLHGRIAAHLEGQKATSAEAPGFTPEMDAERDQQHAEMQAQASDAEVRP